MPEAKEPRRLEQYVTDLSIANDGLQGRLESYNPASIRKVFYQRVFNESKPGPPQGEEATKLVKYKDKVVPYGELYRHLREEIDDLVAYMTAPVGQGILQSAGSSEIENQRIRTPFGRRTVCDIAHRASNLAKLRASDCQNRTQPPYPQFHQTTNGRCCNEERFYRSEQLEELVGSPKSQSTRLQAPQGVSNSDSRCTQQTRAATQLAHNQIAGLTNRNDSNLYQWQLSDFADPSLGSIIDGNPASTTGSQLRLRNCFGDPATADFNPNTSGQNCKFTVDPQEAFPSRGMFNSDAASIRTEPSDGYMSKVPRQAGNSPRINYPELAKSIRPSNTNLTPQINMIRPSVGGTGHDSDGCAIASGMNRLPAVFRDKYDATIHGQSHVSGTESINSRRQKLHNLSQRPNLERSLISTHFQFPTPQMPPQDHTPFQAQPLYQVQAHAQQQTEARIRYQTEQLPQFESLQGPVQPLLSQAPMFRGPGQHISAVPIGLAPTHFSAAHSHTLGALGELLPGSIQQDPNRLLANPHQQQLHQPLPHYQSSKQGFYGDAQLESLQTGMVAGQPFIHTPNVGLHHHIQRGAMPSVPTTSYIQPYIPADKYARAPAPNRLASRFTQANAFQPIQSPIALTKSGAQSRFPSPVPSPRASLTTLLYRSGFDDMFPNQRPGIASIRYQDLTREEPPSFAIAGDENYLPFVQTANLARPAEWGVLKVSNVSLVGKERGSRLF